MDVFCEQLISEITGNVATLQVIERVKKFIASIWFSNNIQTHSLRENILRNKDLRQKLIEISTNWETYFFRDPLYLDVIKDYAIDFKRPLKILSVACATGQEPWTNAMFLDKNKIDYDITWIDISEIRIQVAKNGIYPERAIQRIPSQEYTELFEMYTDKKLIIEKEGQREKKTTIYSVKDSLKAPYFKDCDAFRLPDTLSWFDIILCRNFSIYLELEKSKILFRSLIYRLKQGWLFFPWIDWRIDSIFQNELKINSLARYTQNQVVGYYKKINF